MKDTSSRLTMVTSLSWMANARTSSFIARALVGIRNGLMLRSVGSNNMFLPVHFLRQEWHVVCQRVRKVHQFLLRGIWGLAVFGLSCFSFVPCAFWEFWLCWFTPSCVQGLDHVGVPPAGHALWAEVGGRHYLCNVQVEKIHKIAFQRFGLCVGL